MSKNQQGFKDDDTSGQTVLGVENTIRLKREGRTGDDLANTVALSAVTVFVLVTWLMTLSSPWSSFSFHPPFQSLALGLFTYGILTLQPTSQPRAKAAGLARHQLFMLITAFPVFLAGTWSAYYTKNVNNRQHFVSWHGTLGILMLLWTIVQIIVGGGSVWYGGAMFGGGIKAKSLWKYHRLSGYILYSTFLFTLHLGGAWSKFATGNSPYVVRFLAYTIAPLVLLFSVSFRIRLSKMQFF